MAKTKELYSLVLAAGEGRRMQAGDRHKVCFDVAGVPAIVRALETYNRAGVDQNVVVVGAMAGQVIQTVGQAFSNAVFAYQSEARGTGDAARCGMRALSSVGDDACILVVAGDKLIESSLLLRLVESYEQFSSDLSLLVTPAAIAARSAGRVLFRADGSPLAIVEMSDVRLRKCRRALQRELQASSSATMEQGWCSEILATELGDGATLEMVLGNPQWDLAGNGQLDRDHLLEGLREATNEFSFGSQGLVVSADDAARSNYCNESVYLVRAGALRYGLEYLTKNNVLGEEHLTEAVTAILTATDDQGPRFRCNFVATQKSREVMSFNNPEELLEIEDVLQGQRCKAEEQLVGRMGPERLRTVDNWQEIFSADEHRLATDETLRSFYGDAPDLIRERQTAYATALSLFRKEFGGDAPVILVRSPGRINIMGRHIDWQGGCCNLMAVNQEVILVASPRDDDRIEIRNVQREEFSDTSISLGQLVSQLDWDDWLSCVNSLELQRRLRQSAGHWSFYIEAAIMRLQMEYRQQKLVGMNLVVSGNIPVAAGMSSSSALVVSTAEAAVALNGLDVVPRQFVNFCGEGEWFVGTRGGSADHAAMKFGAKGAVSHVKFHDFDLLSRVRFPEDHHLVVCNSFLQAKKAAGARAIFNSRVGSYLLGIAWIHAKYPQYAPLVQFVRDICPDHLGVALAQIYRVILSLPKSVTAQEARELASYHPVAQQQILTQLDDPEAPREYPIRAVMLFGVAECARAKQALACLENDRMEELGRLMSISHDGERCYRVADDLSHVPFESDVSDTYLQGLIDDVESEDPKGIGSAQLHNQPGGYGCSVLEVDALVDIALRTPGVLGAQLAGAGLGGCAMAIVRADAVAALNERLQKLFYQPKGLPSGIEVCVPAAGSCVVSVTN